MAFAVEAFSGVNSFGASAHRVVRRPGVQSAKRRSFPAGAGFIGAGVAAATCILVALAGMHSMATPFVSAASLSAAIAPSATLHANAPLQQRLIHVPKFSRLRADQSELADLAARTVSRDAVLAALKPKLADAAAARVASLKSSLIERGTAKAPSTEVAAAETAKTPSAKQGPQRPAAQILALASKPISADAAPSAATALVETTPVSPDDTSPKPFNLVLADSRSVPDDDAIPLPAKRPGMPQTISLAPKKVEQPTRQMLAYASPKTAIDDEDNEPMNGRTSPAPVARGRTAIYDIAAHTVYLPSGERLEAHSGMGPMRDNPRYVKQKNRGPTPPHTYVLSMREALFHGVAALRLTPLDPSAIHGRDGILAHTYMLGSRGDSNGCVVFRDYKRFLAAFRRGEVDRMVVVASSSARPFGLAMR